MVMTSEIRSGRAQGVDGVAELTETAVAVEAEDPAHFPGLVRVVDVLRSVTPTDRAHAVLFGNEAVEVVGPDPVPPHQVVMPTTSIQALL